VEAHYDKIFRGAVSVTGDPHLAEEIVQDTFVSAFRKFESFSGRSSVFTWLYRIMLNNYCKHCRKRKLLRRSGFVRTDGNPGETNDLKSQAPSPAATLAKSEERELLLRAINTLRPKLRIVIAMRYFDGLPLNKIATILGCQPGTVKSRLFSARKRLCQILQKEPEFSHASALSRS
jgi:RNA polymerase sigma-70 factor (ECF subfamily)